MRTLFRLLAVLTTIAATTAFVSLATADEARDERGWTKGGTVAVAAPARLAGPKQDRTLDLPKFLDKQLPDKVILVYFSPVCPHCQAAQPELNALSQRIDVPIVGVASPAASAIAMREYKQSYEVPYPLVHDPDHEVASAMAIESTPSAILVEKRKGKWVVIDFWYPYTQGYDTLVEMRVAADPWSAFRPGEYQGTMVCAQCHLQETEAWVLSHHSVAWRTLVEKGETANAECTGCHVTGNGQPTGWDGDPHSPLVDVGCEACHSAGGPHDGEQVEPASTCEGCHDEKHSIAFSYAKGLPLLDHFATVHMTDETFRQRRLDLAEGNAPRALLAFEKGRTVGSQACRSCHEAEFEHWKGSPHAAAMSTLKGESHEGTRATKAVACVRCHATQVESGLPADTLDGFRTSEAVGCESCHGPGEAHVQAKGGTDNIEALGEDCPVCVLEALCTSCHTKAWDEGWELETRLQAIRHGRSE